MKIVISSGHGKHVRGASGYIDEVDEARLVVEEAARILRTMGVATTTYHDDISRSQSENLDRIVSFHNGKTRDLDVSVHFNASETTSKPMGAEVLYVTQDELADEVVDAICDASGLVNRGPKKRTDLAFLNRTNEPAILIETCFVDSQADVDIYRARFDDICRAIADGIAGSSIEPPEPVPPPPEVAQRTLRKGMTGTDVAALQKVLGLPADGDFGEITETQVEGFQAACDLDADGIVGPQTWSEVRALAARIDNGDTGLTDELTRQIVATAEASPPMELYWPGRGVAPAGYIPGMCLSYAVALQEFHDGDDAANAMAGPLGHADVDALAWYASELAALGLRLTSTAERLRALFLVQIGLGMRESSGRWCEGRDMSASNVAADTAEAGLFQTSWNIASAHRSIPPLLDLFWHDPNGFLDEFADGISPSASNLDCWGSGDGATYQWLAKFCPLFAVMTTGVGLRFRRQHWGPVNRKEVTLEPAVDALLRDVQRLVLRAAEA